MTSTSLREWYFNGDLGSSHPLERNVGLKQFRRHLVREIWQNYIESRIHLQCVEIFHPGDGGSQVKLHAQVAWMLCCRVDLIKKLESCNVWCFYIFKFTNAKLQQQRDFLCALRKPPCVKKFPGAGNRYDRSGGGSRSGWRRGPADLKESHQVTWSRWWFELFFMFTPTWGRFPIWLIFFKWVETTN